MIFLALAITALLIGYGIRLLRWKLFIEIYEDPHERSLLRAMALGSMISFFVPYRLGDLARAVYAGRRMKNGLSFSLVTIIVERYLDILFVCLFFIVLNIIRPNRPAVVESTTFYLFLSFCLLATSVIILKFNRYVKLTIKTLASVFNENIKLRLMFFCWAGITAFRDIYNKISARTLFGYSFAIWAFNFLSYYCLALYMRTAAKNYTILDSFMAMFSKESLGLAVGRLSPDGIAFDWTFSLYIFIPPMILVLLSFPPRLLIKIYKNFSKPKNDFLNILPHLNRSEQLLFLNGYFAGNNRNYFKQYLEVNRGVHVIADYSAGSNATTMLCMDSGQTFYRKCAFGADADKLYAQLQWLDHHSEVLPLPRILKRQNDPTYCYYDMEYVNSAVEFFNYIHSAPIDKSWDLLERIFKTLESNLHTVNRRDSDPQQLQAYIKNKVASNLNAILKNKEISKLADYDQLVINDVPYRNLTQLLSFLSPSYLTTVFSADGYSDIHGDLTVENIISVLSNSNQDNFYLIDPNTGNLHNSPNLDYAKLLQSLHGGYEFYTKTNMVTVHHNNIKFVNTSSKAYSLLCAKYKDYLCSHFTPENVRSIFFHEIVHWLRLMPYRIRRSQATLFYAGLVIIFNDIVEMFD